MRGVGSRPLLEREDSLAAIDSVIDGLNDGDSSVLVFEGQAGIGKTALLDEAERRAQGLAVLRANGGEFERDLPLGIVRQLLEPRLRRTDRSRIPSGDAAAVRIELYWTAVAMAEEEPLLLVVDDLHWADRESLDWLLFTVRRLHGSRIALIAAMRPAEPGAPEEELATLAAQPGVVLHRPAVLSSGATASLVRAWSEADSVATEFEAACHRMSGGNPFLLGELLSEASRAGVEPDHTGAERLDGLVPEGLARAVLLRLRPLGPEARALAQSVAVMGMSVELRHAAALAELSSDDATTAADALVRVAVLRDADPLDLAHPVLRAAVLSELSAPALGALHARAARLLAADGAAPDLVGAHLLAAPASQDQWIIDRLLEASEHARERGAPAAAALLLERALAEPPTDERRAAVETALGSALSTSGDSRGIEHLQAARELTGDPISRARLTLRGGAPFFLLGRGAEMADLIRVTLEELGDQEPTVAFTLRASLSAAPVSGASFDPRGLIAELLEQSPGIDTLDPVGRLGLASLAIGACVVAAPAAAVAATSRQALGDLEQHRAAVAHGFPLLSAIIALGLAESADQLEERLAMVEEGVRERGALALGLAMLRCTQAQLALHAGALASAEDQARAATSMTAETNFPLLRNQSLALLATALRRSGKAEEADIVLAALPPPERGGAWAALARNELAALALERGDHATALRESSAAGEIADPIGAVNPVVFGSWRSTAALARWAADEHAEAMRLAVENVAHARSFGAPGTVGAAMRLEGLVRDDLDLLAEAERVLAPSVARLEHAMALVDLGSALRRRGERVKAREPLGAGMDLAQRCGANPLVERARTELRAAGARPRSVVRTGVESLTPSERRVAELAAEGRTNREIGQELFVTKSTVETHLRSVFRKLDVEARTGLAERLAASS